MAIQRALSIEDRDLVNLSTVKATQNKEYTDLDISLALTSSTKDVFRKHNAEAVKFAVRNLLLTNQGEKPFNPYFGGNLSSFLFELTDDYTEKSLVREIKNVIEVYEPRVDINSLIVNVNMRPDENSAEVTVIFKIINTGELVEFTTVLSRLR
jgi:phage baseplate assembly protein W